MKNIILAIAVATLLVTALWWQSTTTDQATTEPGPPSHTRVVALSPSYCEVVDKLGLNHVLVGVSSHCTIAALSGIPVVGSFANPSFEKIISLQPDLVLATPHAMVQKMLQQLNAMGIKVYAHQPDRMSDIRQINVDVARVLGVESRGHDINNEIDEHIKRTKSSLKNLAAHGEDRSALFLVGSKPLVVAGQATFISEIFENLGFLNSADMSRAAWPLWPAEKLISSPPRFIFILEGKSERHKYDRIFSGLGYDHSQKPFHIFAPAKPLFFSPSPQLIDDLNFLRKSLQDYF